MPPTNPLNALFRPASLVFVGGSNLNPALHYHREQGFAGLTWVVNSKYEELGGFPCFPSVEALPGAPDLAFVAIRSEAAIEMIQSLRDRGCKAIVCNAAGFAETGGGGTQLQAHLVEAIGDMAALGPNSVGLVNYVDPMAAMMDHFGVRSVEGGAAIISQGGGVLCDAVFADRTLPITHMVGCGNQARTTVADCLDYLLDDPRVSCVGLGFEGLPDITGLRRAAVKALRLGKPIVALKFGKSEAGMRAVASHTASMTGTKATWTAVFDRLGIVGVESISEFFETLKLFDSGQAPKGRRVLVTAASGVMGVMLADHLSDAGFELPPPSAGTVAKLRDVLPGISTPGNPQDVTMAVWNDIERQTAIYKTLLEDDYDIAMMVQNYPREGMWDISEYEAQVEALGCACKSRNIAGMQLSPLVDCFPAAAREHTISLGLAAMQGLDETITAMKAALWWHERRGALMEAGLDLLLADSAAGMPQNATWIDEAAAKTLIGAAGVPVPRHIAVPPVSAPAAASALGFPVVVKALDARLLHKADIGAVKLGLNSMAQVAEAVAEIGANMSRHAPAVALKRVLIETMASDAVAEIMASVRIDPITGPMLMIAGGGIEAELWEDLALVFFPVTRAEVERALDQLKTTRRIDGYRGRPGGDRKALVDVLMALVAFAEANTGRLEEIEINPILVGSQGVVAVDAVLKMEHADV